MGVKEREGPERGKVCHHPVYYCISMGTGVGNLWVLSGPAFVWGNVAGLATGHTWRSCTYIVRCFSLLTPHHSQSCPPTPHHSILTPPRGKSASRLAVLAVLAVLSSQSLQASSKPTTHHASKPTKKHTTVQGRDYGHVTRKKGSCPDRMQLGKYIKRSHTHTNVLRAH